MEATLESLPEGVLAKQEQAITIGRWGSIIDQTTGLTVEMQGSEKRE